MVMTGTRGRSGAWQQFVGFWVGASDTERIAEYLAHAPEHIRATLLNKINCESLRGHVESRLRQRQEQLSLL